MISVGATVGNYRVVQKIGHGAMGEVWAAHHPTIGKRVALKVIHHELSTNEEMISRFFNEARAVTQIGHENIVDVQDFGQTPDGDSFIVMELLEGAGLGDRMTAEGIFSVARAMHIGMQIADGLAAAHARGIIHRDLKPDNIILISRGGDTDFVKILDFGLAKLTGPGAMNHKTKTGSLLGTPHYMAPEQAEGKKYDHRVDIYALGCILFQMLAGRVPFPGQGFGEVLVKHLREPPPLPSRINPQVPPAVEKIILHALAKKPEFRFASMEEFRSALRDPERFAQKLDASSEEILQNNTPGEPFPAPMLPASTATPTMIAPPSAPQKLPDDAPTIQGQAPPEVQAILAAREAASKNAAAAAFDVSTAPGLMRAESKTMAQGAPPRRRGKSGAPLLWIALGAGLALVGVVVAVVLLKSSAVHLRITTIPAGADVWSGDDKLCTTPCDFTHKGKEPLKITIKKAGFEPVERVLAVDGDQTLKLPLQATEEDDAPTKIAPPTKTSPTKTSPAKTAPPKTPSTAKTPPPKTPVKAAEPPKAEPSGDAPKKKHHKRDTENPLLLTPSF